MENVAAQHLNEDRTLIRFWNVNVELQRRTIIQDIDLNIREGEVVCVVGPSGSGKTTMLRTIAGFIQPSAGTLTVSGKEVTKPSRDTAIVFQDYGRALLPWRNASRNIELAMEACRIPRRERPLEISRLLKLMGLQAHGDKYPRQMSGGMQQRLQIARCLAQKPSVILMDEPFAFFDDRACTADSFSGFDPCRYFDFKLGKYRFGWWIAPANLEMDRIARFHSWRDDDAVGELAQFEARGLPS